MRFTVVFLFLFINFDAFAQNPNPNYKTKKVVIKDSIVVDSVSINPSRFIIKDSNGKLIDSSLTMLIFLKLYLLLKNLLQQTL